MKELYATILWISTILVSFSVLNIWVVLSWIWWLWIYIWSKLILSMFESWANLNIDTKKDLEQTLQLIFDIWKLRKDIKDKE